MTKPLTVTRQGDSRPDNRDFAGSAYNSGIHFHVITDGSSRAGSRELAKALTQHLLTSFAEAAPHEVSDRDKALGLILALLATAHSSICPDFPHASTSYLAMLVFSDAVISIHAGDCCLGVLLEGQPINWLNPPHCGPNWKGDLQHSFIADSPARKTLFNCMSYRRANEPEVLWFPVLSEAQWVLATDGFWAELAVEKQLGALLVQSLDDCSAQDDITFLLLNKP
ncbi:MAG: hypothetical protein GAK37_02804 [Pseudomonas sp.]|nr:MAG: hypothetical protein GAK37_02804 [Pseudomonas sp.]